MHTILIVEQNRAELRTLEGDFIELKPLQEIVGGYIDVYPMGRNLLAVLNDEGLIRDLPVTTFATFIFKGPVVIDKSSGENMVGLSGADIKAIKDAISQPIENEA